MFKLYNHNYDDRLEQMMNGNCSDCGEQYELDALDLDLRCADCVEQRATDLRQETK
jgi:DNA-directed RNA polymerase subunit RPC12/RpoP